MAEPLTEESTAFERLFRFLGRPGFAVQSVLGGVGGALSKGSLDPLVRGLGDAAENSVMFGQELATGSWLHGVNPTSLLGYGSDLTTRAERPEFADTLRRSGLPAPQRGSWGELGVNVVGGALTDPLTYVGGVGFGAKAGRVAEGAAAGLGAARAAGAARRAAVAERAVAAGAKGVLPEAKDVAALGLAAEKAVARGLRGTPEGAALLASKGDDAVAVIEDVLKRSELDDAVNNAVRDRAQELLTDDEFIQRVRLSPGANPTSAHSPGVPEGALRQMAHEQALADLGVTFGEGSVRSVALHGGAEQAPLLKGAIRYLEGERYLKPAGVPTLELPFVPWRAFPGNADLWAKVGVFTPARVVNEVIRRLPAGSPVADALEVAGRHAVETLERTFVDKLAGLAPAGLSAMARQIAGEGIVRKVAERQGGEGPLGRSIAQIFGEIPDEIDKVIGRVWINESEQWRKLHQFSGSVRKGEAPIAKVRRDLIAAAGLPEDALQARADRLLPNLEGIDPANAATVRLAYMLSRDKVGAAVAAVDPSMAEKAMQALDGYVDKVQRIQRDLVREGLWDGAATPFYVPHQASEAFALFLGQGSLTKKIGGRGPTYAQAIHNVYQGSREKTLAELVQGFNDVADHYKVPRPELDDLLDSGAPLREAAPGLMETRLSQLLSRRVDAHVDTLSARRLEKLVKDHFPGAKHATTVDRFLNAALAPIGARRGVVEKLLGGGEFRVGPGHVGEQGVAALERAQKVLGGRPGALGPDRAMVYKFPGLSSIYKPLLYLGTPLTPAISSISRNVIGGVVNGLMDPEIGFSGAKGLFEAAQNLPIVKHLGLPPKETGLALRALHHPNTLTPADLAKLQQIRVGEHSLSDLLEHARAGVVQPKSFADAELFNRVADTPAYLKAVAEDGYLEHFLRAVKGELSPALTGRMLETFRAFMRPLADMTSAVEDGMRLGSFFGLVRKGYDPATAADTVAKHYVDYAFQSGAERFTRDLFPFARYQIGITPVAAKGLTSGVGRAVGHAVNTRQEGVVLPPEIRGQTAIPMGVDAEGNPRFVTSLGLPFEPMVNTVSLLGLANPFNPSAKRTFETTLGSMSPVVKTPLELMAGRSFYSGQPIAERDRGPEWLPSWLPGVTEEVTPGGKTVTKVPPFAAHALLGLLPISRIASELDKWVKVSHGDYGQWVNLLTGVKLRTVDSEREAEKVIKRALARAAEAGDVGTVQKFFVKGRKEDADPEVLAAMERLAELEKRRRARSR